MVSPYWEINGSKLYQGHVLDVLRAIASGSIHMIATSPPYWGLRDYQLPPIEWPSVSYSPMAGLAPVEIPGCEAGCKHEWGEPVVKVSSGGPAESQTLGGGKTNTQEGAKFTASSQYCQLCGGWRGSLGLEPTIEQFVGHLILICRELKRVLRDDGTCWLNLGSSYQDKQEMGIPWRVAFALQADGWYLRSDIIWAKGISFCPTYSGSCMPESVRDRPTKGHEYVFLLSKSKRYYYDADAVRESAIKGSANSGPRNYTGLKGEDRRQHLQGTQQLQEAGRNLRTVWAINPGNFKGAHFATFPPKLVEPMIKASTSAKGCCPECGKPWRRVIERVQGKPQHTPGGQSEKTFTAKGQHGATSLLYTGGGAQHLTTGWTPTCTCSEPIDSGGFDPQGYPIEIERVPDPIPCTVLDPFAGSGTTMEVAIKLRRKAIGIELSKEYCDAHIIPRLSKPIQRTMLLDV